MNHSTQYTVRQVPHNVDAYLRRLAHATGKSLNKVIVDELSERAGVHNDAASIVDRLDWFIGMGLDDATAEALDAYDTQQKQLIEREQLKRQSDLKGIT